MDDVSFSRLVEAVANQAKALGTFVESQGSINSSLTDKIDKMAGDAIPKKTINDLDTKIGNLGKAASKTEEVLGKLNETLGGVSEAIKKTNKLTASQTRMLEKMDPGSRRLKGDTYDNTGRSEQRITRAINKMGGSWLVRNPIKSAIGGALAFKPMRSLWDNKLLLSLIAGGGMMNPDTLRQMLAGANLQKLAFGPEGGKGFSAPTDWMLDNPWTTAGIGAGAYLGRKPLWAGAKLAGRGALWGGGKALGAAKWAYGGGMGSAINRGSTLAGGRFAGVIGARSWLNRGAQRFGGAVAAGIRPNIPRVPTVPGTSSADSFRRLWNAIKKDPKFGRVGKRSFVIAAKDAIRNGASRGVAKRAAALIAARAIQGIGIAAGTGGAGAPITIGLWAYTIYQIADMLLADVIEDWFTDTQIERELAAQTKLKQGALKSKQAGLIVKDPETGLFLDAKQFIAANPKTINAKRTGNMAGHTGLSGMLAQKSSLTADQIRRNAQIASYTRVLKDDDVRLITRDNQEKHRMINKILHLSDGKEFIGRVWTENELYDNATLPELNNLYSQVVLPRAKSDNAKKARKTEGSDSRGTAMKYEGGSAVVEGSRAWIAPAEEARRAAEEMGMDMDKIKEGAAAAKLKAEEGDWVAGGFGAGKGGETPKEFYETAIKAQITSNTEGQKNILSEQQITNEILRKMEEYKGTPASGPAAMIILDNADPVNKSFEGGRQNRKNGWAPGYAPKGNI